MTLAWETKISNTLSKLTLSFSIWVRCFKSQIVHNGTNSTNSTIETLEDNMECEIICSRQIIAHLSGNFPVLKNNKLILDTDIYNIVLPSALHFQSEARGGS